MPSTPPDIGQPWMWAAFILFVLAMLALDLFALGGKRAHRVSVREALGWSLAWVTLALIFNALLWWHLTGTAGREVADQKALEFLTGYLIEKSLSVDNIFVFLLIFTSFKVHPEFQRRVLLYGVLGAIILRAVMILGGAWLVKEFNWILYLFGAFLVFTGVRMIFADEEEPELDDHPVLRVARRYLRVTSEYREERFFVVENGIRFATPLFLVLLLVETSDVIFAVDSIPAIFAITTDPFIVFTSNIFAILGLRALYFVLADMADRFHLLKYGLAVVLAFIGVKMLIVPWFHIPTAVSLAVVGGVLTASVLLSLMLPVKGGPEPDGG